MELKNPLEPSLLSVLCVDERRAVRELLYEIITRLGHICVTAVDGRDEQKKLADAHFDLVITGLKIPRMNGIELIKRVRTDFEYLTLISIIDYEMVYKYTEIIELGAADLISKSFNLDKLGAKINGIIRERNLRAQLKRLSSRDILICLYNRRCFDENLRHEVARGLQAKILPVSSPP